MKFTRLNKLSFLVIAVVLFQGCATLGSKQMEHTMHHDKDKMMMDKHDMHADACCGEDMPTFTKAVAVLHPTAGNTAEGIVTFTRTDSGVRVVAELKNVSPGNHGFHIHAYGDVSAPDGTSAGGHFNPAGMSHGGPMAGERHSGDMGNVVADENGVARLDYVDAHMRLNGPESIIGRGVILHADEDDLTSQPTGAAGARIASGVVGIAK